MRRGPGARCLLAQLAQLCTAPTVGRRGAGRDRSCISAAAGASSSSSNAPSPWWHAARARIGAAPPYAPYPIACAGSTRPGAAPPAVPPPFHPPREAAAASARAAASPPSSDATSSRATWASPPPRATSARASAAAPEAPPAAPPARASARILDGRAYAAAWAADIAAAVAARSAAGAASRPPGLAVILVGDCVDSLLYVRNKRDACAAAGIAFQLIKLPGDVAQKEVCNAVRAAVADEAVHGVLVQLPLPPHLDEEAILETVCPSKDVDGFHPLNAGRLSMRGRTPLFVPCTPKGCLELLRRARVPVAGAIAVVLGNSNTVGMPLSLLLRDCGAAAVTVCHSAADVSPEAAARTAAVARTADILVAAVGRPGLVRGSWVKPGAAVLDVGINPVPAEAATGTGTPATSAGFGAHMSLADLGAREWRVVGDVAADEVAPVAGALTPVPGGVGPMTIAALLDNVMHAWTRAEFGEDAGAQAASAARRAHAS